MDNVGGSEILVTLSSRWPLEPSASQSCDPILQSAMIASGLRELCNKGATSIDHWMPVGGVSDVEALSHSFLEYLS